MSYINFENVTKEYVVGNNTKIKAVNQVNFEIEQGEFVVILGASGAGKTTLLNLLGGMDSLSSGTIKVNKNLISSFDAKKMTLYRRNNVGFVFQFYNLIPDLTALENVELATQDCDNPLDPKKSICDVGLENRQNNFPSQLSGGEQQRVSIARAIAKNPDILLCDEPTGALDSQTGQHIFSLLKSVATDRHKTVIVVTHNAEFAEFADRVIKMKDGQIEVRNN
ncbi:ABC transporter ATP-binding protein [Xylocopilactobacillus apicola]|uniref:ABC transporter ATP-binding protein n=1 Tax=Xylocopilactobacillus apicola TaxID=2932184 RepID=A0AAU9D3M6_9LACO|nr:ABC transporter ATP-binding protein [Xylocopilactobacillus apicola]BDR58048.1 ABC transporter ATP-binding protein [Xylocopilactobacillus apicola]